MISVTLARSSLLPGPTGSLHLETSIVESIVVFNKHFFREWFFEHFFYEQFEDSSLPVCFFVCLVGCSPFLAGFNNNVHHDGDQLVIMHSFEWLLPAIPGKLNCDKGMQRNSFLSSVVDFISTSLHVVVQTFFQT